MVPPQGLRFDFTVERLFYTVVTPAVFSNTIFLHNFYKNGVSSPLTSQFHKEVHLNEKLLP